MEKLNAEKQSTERLKILTADDDLTALRLITYLLVNWGFDVVTASDGRKALEILSQGGIDMALLDRTMPIMEGVEVVRQLRNAPPPGGYIYTIMITAKDSIEDIVSGLDAGADDYLKKPYDEDELRSRIRVGERVLELERKLAARAAELQKALDNVKQLRGLLPVCMYCKKIRNDRDYWQQMEGYIQENTDASFTHSVCPECREKIVKPMLDELQKRKDLSRVGVCPRMR